MWCFCDRCSFLSSVPSGIWKRQKVHPVTGTGSAIDRDSRDHRPRFVIRRGVSSSTPTPLRFPEHATRSQALAAADQQAGYPPAIEIADPTGFVNASSSFSFADLIGKKVILLDFWTYSCINCIRTIPYLNAGTRGIMARVLRSSASIRRNSISKRISRMSQPRSKSTGSHIPSFWTAITAPGTRTTIFIGRMNILIDMAGYIVHDQVGEGNYAETESEIQKFLAERDEILGLAAAPLRRPRPSLFRQSVISGGIFMSPETYLGFVRNGFQRTNGVSGNAGAGIQTLAAPRPWNRTAPISSANGILRTSMRRTRRRGQRSFIAITRGRPISWRARRKARR